MKELILDVKKWRCGGFNKHQNKLGEGITQLLNPKGYMCCLGMFSCQLGVKKQDILNISSPEDLNTKILGLNKKIDECFINTKLSDQAMEINDDTTTTPQEKIKQLKTLFSKNGFKIKVKNERLLKK